MEYLIKGKENPKCDICKNKINGAYFTILRNKDVEICINCYRWYCKELFKLNAEKLGLNKFNNSGLFAISNNQIERDIRELLKNQKNNTII
jgi:hypothetical protein